MLILIGIVSLALGALGVFLPLLPTTPFILVSAFAFANSSEKLHQWLLNHNVFGPLIANWHSHGAIGRRTKIVSLVSMVAIIGISLLLGVPTHVIVIQAVVLTASAIFIITRPLPPE
ncbi:MAG: YbaN family protein [Woeseiaceae bacterium]|nr:YbaN family protein [Woeseiaceae bacterium]